MSELTDQITVTIAGQECAVTGFSYKFNDCDNVEFEVNGVINKYLFQEGDNKMSELNKIPKELERFLSDNYKAFYQLGWVDRDLELTQKGRLELGDFLMKQNEDAFGKHASELIAQMTVKEKKAEEN